MVIGHNRVMRPVMRNARRVGNVVLEPAIMANVTVTRYVSARSKIHTALLIV